MNNNNQSHDLPNIGLSNQQLLSSLNANSAAGGGNATNISSANTNNSHPTTASTSTLPSCSTTNSIAINIPLSQLPSPTLCASCDKCRQRKTKCDGGRPCLNCITRYRKTKKLDARYVFILFSVCVVWWRVLYKEGMRECVRVWLRGYGFVLYLMHRFCAHDMHFSL